MAGIVVVDDGSSDATAEGVRGYRWMQYGCHLRDAGDRAGAGRAFRAAWLHFPPRPGNLRAWILGR